MAQFGTALPGNYLQELGIIQQHLNFNHSPSGDVPEWHKYPEIPSAEDLNPDWDDPKALDKINSLLPNTWQQPWPDKNTYLETHYRLQREEAITVLRHSVKKYRQDPMIVDDEDTCVYTKIFVRGYLMTRLGPMCRIQFSTERAGKKIRWTQTRRLTTGSLVVLSTAEDGFKTICMPAIIADHPIRDGLDQVPPTIQIFWANTNDAILDPAIELVMLESRVGYFEAVRHCMVGLKHVANTDTPLDKYLVYADKSDLAAQCVCENPRMNIGSLVHHVPDSLSLSNDTIQTHMAELKESLRNYHVLNGINDSLSPYTNLDNSQLSAVHRILTKELAIIQGPPGTGKTFTSVQALRILLDSQQDRGSNVIIVAAQTNHAVDQILIQLIKLGFNTVRLGGRTHNEDIKRYSLYNLRRHVMPSKAQSLDKDYRTFEAARKRTITRLEDAVRGIFSEELIDPQALRSAGLITENQLESLQAEDGWAHATSADRPSGMLAQWLGDQCVEVPSMDFREPDFETPENDETADFDAEDFNVELDDCIADDDESRGRVDGKWVPIKHRWTGANPRQYAENDLVIRRELNRDNLWDVGVPLRGAIYQYWQREMLRFRLTEFRDTLAANVRICKNLKANRWHKDLRCIKMAQIEILGCTTTGLCKYRGLLAALQPRTMLIEEAAETKEANILSALYPSLQQLILVGDHQQLAPHCDTPGLRDAPFHMRVSMFERLVKLHMPYTMLNMQRRMNPLLREVLTPFYPSLQDHPVVTSPGARPPIPGMSDESFFFHHTWSEGTDENLSKFNTLEAEMVVRFVDYLLMNDVAATEITVLTFYRGQRKKMLSEFRKLGHRAPFTNVHTVDSYQGEENDIVILSLVRSNGANGPHRAGFLRDSNRGVVSISRARRGFFIFGNMINLVNACQESFEMWNKVERVFRSQNRFGSDSRFPVTCQKHNTTTWITHPEDWINYHGGCIEPCPDKLECGHDCGRRCHWIPHHRLVCMRPCAFPHDKVWNDGPLLDQAGRGTGTYTAFATPFVGSDGRLGGLRGSRLGSGDRRGEIGYYSNSTQLSQQRAMTHGQPTRLDGIPGYSWTTFDARQDDAQRQKVYHQSTGLGSSNPHRPAPQDDQDTVDLISPIRETFRQVTLTQQGQRSVKEGVVSKRNGTPSPEKTKDGLLENIRPTQRAGDAADLISFDDTVHREDLTFMDPSPRAHRSFTELFKDLHGGDLEQIGASTLGRSGAPAGYSPIGASINASNPQRKLSTATMTDQQYRVHIHGPDHSAMRNTGRPDAGENKPEWEYASTMAESNEDPLDGNDEDLIVL
ncbi:P-loop containing nucleoside triphosphate hydrolase protein [Xylariaceae sp. FL1651]|nr:P-loop containing nucleoside triphosphate hydrolase protein [Xylariaceae sp. FL1651]